MLFGILMDRFGLGSVVPGYGLKHLFMHYYQILPLFCDKNLME